MHARSILDCGRCVYSIDSYGRAHKETKNCCTCLRHLCGCGNTKRWLSSSYRIETCTACDCDCGQHYNYKFNLFYCKKNCPKKTCFPAIARLTLLNGKTVTISELHPGDKVQTGNDFISIQTHGF